MHETAPDAPDWDEYEAEQERARRHRERINALYEQVEMRMEEREIETNAGNQYQCDTEKWDN